MNIFTYRYYCDHFIGKSVLRMESLSRDNCHNEQRYFKSLIMVLGYVQYLRPTHTHTPRSLFTVTFNLLWHYVLYN